MRYKKIFFVIFIIFDSKFVFAMDQISNKKVKYNEDVISIKNDDFLNNDLKVLIPYYKDQVYKSIELEDRVNFKSYLLKIGSNCFKDKDGNNLLHIAAKYKKIDFFKSILNLNFRTYSPENKFCLINQVNNLGQSVLDIAFENKDYELLRFILGLGVDFSYDYSFDAFTYLTKSDEVLYHLKRIVLLLKNPNLQNYSISDLKIRCRMYFKQFLPEYSKSFGLSRIINFYISLVLGNFQNIKNLNDPELTRMVIYSISLSWIGTFMNFDLTSAFCNFRESIKMLLLKRCPVGVDSNKPFIFKLLNQAYITNSYELKSIVNEFFPGKPV